MLKTTIIAGLFAAAVTPGAVTYQDGNDALNHAVGQIRDAKAKPLRVCYDAKEDKKASRILLDAKATDGSPFAFEVRKLEAGGWRVAKIEQPAEWPHAVSCSAV